LTDSTCGGGNSGKSSKLIVILSIDFLLDVNFSATSGGCNNNNPNYYSHDPPAPVCGARQSGRTNAASSGVKPATIGYDDSRWQFPMGFRKLHGKSHGLPKKVLYFSVFFAFYGF